MKAFLDMIILLDWYLDSRPFNDKAKKILSAGKEGYFEIVISVQSIIDSAYCLRKTGVISEVFMARLNFLRSFVQIVGIDEIDLSWAIEHHSEDFEDDMQYASAYNNVCDYFITRDVELLRRNTPRCPMTVITPQEFVSKMM